MEYATWAPVYEQIAREFGFPFDAEERSAERLESLLPPEARSEPLARVGARLSGRDVVVVGLAPRAGPPPIWRLPSGATPWAVVAADGATSTCLDAGIVPSVIVTDLDGPLATEVAANRRGSLAVVHAHGDNLPALTEWVPQFPGALAGSWAGPPRPALLDVGGFEFEAVDEPDPAARARKLAKLAWARRLIDGLARSGRTPIERWERDGSRVPYSAGRTEESSVESTR